jgi:hypothetical protein
LGTFGDVICELLFLYLIVDVFQKDGTGYCLNSPELRGCGFYGVVGACSGQSSDCPETDSTLK